MKKNITLLFLVFIPIFSLFIGFALNEDLSTGGAELDFNVTWPLIINYSNFNFVTDVTTHMPLHYVILSFINAIFNNQQIVRLIYLLFSFLLPVFLYLNLKKIYPQNKILLILFSSAFLFIPFFRAAVIWPNAHITAAIFFLIGNYYYLKAKRKDAFIYKLINLLFLSLSIYCIQTYLILFIYYLYNYFFSEKIYNFIRLLIFSVLLSIPGFFFIIINPRTANIGNFITKDILYTISSNFSLIFFFLLFLLINKKNMEIITSKIKFLNKIEVITILFLIFLSFYNQELFTSDSGLRGGGFFFKLSYLVFNNNLIFITSFLLGLITSYLLIKHEKRIFYILLIINLMSINFIVYQKYFEPLFLIIISILYKNFLMTNILSNFKNVFIFYSLVFFYFFLAYTNYLNKFTYQLIS
mgnify:FL=1|tara:strand:+ start:107 stop:1342 length:1236 start_codon:yes stop_codon:yes gene_type:complete